MHICCAPDLAYAPVILKEKWDIVGFFYNPNIHPEKEYIKRFKEVEKLGRIYNFPIYKGRYNYKEWFEKTKYLKHKKEGESRCNLCFYIRLFETALFAKELNIRYFTTVLSNSPHKNLDILFKVGKVVEKKIKGVKFIPYNFRKGDGYKKSVQLTYKYNIYRQDYCGCAYSYRDRLKEKKQKEDIEKKLHQPYPLGPITAVSCILYDDEDNYLFIKREHEPDKGKLALIGGVVKAGEKLKDAIKREVYEEAGYKITIKDFITFSQVIKKDKNNKIKYHYIIFTYLAKLTKKVKDTNYNLKFIKKDKLLNYKYASDIKKLLKQYLANEDKRIFQEK